MDKINAVIKKAFNILRSKEFMKFFIGGGASFLVDFGLLNLQVYVLNFNIFLFDIISVSNAISSITAIIFNFMVQRYWTFKSDDKKVMKQAGKFFLVHGINLIIFNLFLFGLLVNLGIIIPIAKIIVTGLQMINSFILYKFFVFKK